MKNTMTVSNRNSNTIQFHFFAENHKYIENFKNAPDFEEMMILRELESRATDLISRFGAKECSCCKEIKINCAPFFNNSFSYCVDCEGAFLTPVSKYLMVN